MSDPITKRLYDEMSADAALSGLISTYQGDPAIFTADPAPEKAEEPYVMIRAASQNFRDDIIDIPMKTVTREIHCFAEANGDVAAVDDIALRVEEMFKNPHGERFANMDGWYAVLVDTGGPTEASPDERTYGRSVEITVTMEKF